MANQPETTKSSVKEEPGLAFACILDGEGGGRQVGWQQLRDWKPADGPLWAHLDKSAPEAVRWLNDDATRMEDGGQPCCTDRCATRYCSITVPPGNAGVNCFSRRS